MLDSCFVCGSTDDLELTECNSCGMAVCYHCQADHEEECNGEGDVN